MEAYILKNSATILILSPSPSSKPFFPAALINLIILFDYQAGFSANRDETEKSYVLKGKIGQSL